MIPVKCISLHSSLTHFIVQGGYMYSDKLSPPSIQSFVNHGPGVSVALDSFMPALPFQRKPSTAASLNLKYARSGPYFLVRRSGFHATPVSTLWPAENRNPLPAMVSLDAFTG